MIRIAKIVFASLAGLLTLALIALVVATLVIDPDTYRPAVQRQLSEALGRNVSIERLSVGRSLRPTIAVKGLRIANAPWATQPNLVSVNSASVRLDLVPLIHGEVEIGSVDVEGVELSLERDNNGVGNWELPVRTSPDHSDEPAKLPDFDSISLQAVDITWRNIDGRTIDFQVRSIEAVLRDEKPLEIDATLVYRKVPIRAQLKARRSLQSALAGEPVSASLSLDAARTHLDLSIDLRKLSDYKHFEATVAANGERLGALSPLLDQDLPDWGPFAVSTKVAVDDDRIDVSELRSTVDGLPGVAPFAIRKVTVNSGLVSVGSGVPTTLTLSGHLDDVDFVLDATTAELSSLRESLERIPLSAKLRAAGFRLGADGEMRFPDDAFAFDFATSVKGDARVPARIIGNVDISAPLEVDLASGISANQQLVRLTGLKGAVTNCSVDGELAVQYSPDIRVSGALNLGRLDVAAFDDFNVASRTPASNEQKADPSNWLSALDADLRLRAREIIGLPVAASNLSGHAVLRGGRLAIQDFRGSVNDNQLRVSAGLQYKGGRPNVEADIVLPVLDLNRLRGSDKGQKGNESWLDSPLPVSALRDFDADVKIAIANIEGSPVTAQRLRASAQLRRGHLLVSGLDATTAGVTTRSTLKVDATRDDAQLSATGQSKDIDLAGLFKELEVKSDVLGRLADAAVTLETHGTTLRNWLRNAKVKASVGASKLGLRGRNQKLDVDRASIIAGPDVPVQAEMQGKLEQYPLQVSATGGLLADLILADDAWPQISMEIQSVIRKMPVEIRASTALNALRAGRDVPVRLDVHTPNGSVIAVGTIADLEHPERTPLDIAIKMKSLQRTPWKPEKLALPDIPLDVSAKVTVDDGLIALDGVQIKAGETDFAGKIRLHREKRLKLTADLSGNLLDLKPWIPKSEAKVEKVETGEKPKNAKKTERPENVKKTPEAKKAEKSTASDSTLDKPFNLEPMRKFDAAIALRVRRVISNSLDLADLIVDVKLNEGLLDLSKSIAEGGTALKARIDVRTDVPAIAIRFNTKNLDLELLKLETKAITKSSPKLTMNAQFAGSGATLRKIYTSAKGLAVFSAGPGRIVTSSSPFVFQTLSANLLEVLLPGRKPDDFNELECAAARFEVKDGVANSTNGIAFRFKRMDILGSGAINLTTSKILFGFKAVRRRWLDFSILSVASDFASVTGTVSKPRVGLDTQGVLVTGGAAWATAGLSLLATNFLRTMSSSENPCTAILEKGRTASDPIDALMKSLQPASKP